MPTPEENLIKAARAFLEAYDAPLNSVEDWETRFRSALDNLRAAVKTQKRASERLLRVSPT
jgi:hypothetical protein